MGADHYLTKPFSEELVAAIEGLLSRSKDQLRVRTEEELNKAQLLSTPRVHLQRSLASGSLPFPASPAASNLLVVRRQNESTGSSPDQVSLELVERCRGGDEAAWAELVGATHREVYTLCLRILKDPSDASEAATGCIREGLAGLAGFRGDAAFSTWMFGVATNMALSEAPGPQASLGSGTADRRGLEPMSPARSTEEKVAARLDSAGLEAAIRELPHQHRIAIVREGRVRALDRRGGEGARDLGDRREGPGPQGPQTSPRHAAPARGIR